MNNRKFLPYGHQLIDEDDIKAVERVLRSNLITQGPEVDKFEQTLASYCGAKYAAVFSSGTAALHAAYFVAGINCETEILTSPMTFLSTANAALFLGARPIFIDVEEDTGNIDSNLIPEKITARTKAIVPVHYGGHPANLEAIWEIAKTEDLMVIEDACHALGAKYKNKKIGNCEFSDMSIFSFHPIKSITSGEGGAVLTNNGDYSEKLKLFRHHGISTKRTDHWPGDWYYQMQFLGYNYRITDFQLALVLSQLKKLDKFICQRRKIAKVYGNAFKDNDFFHLPIEKEYAESSWHLFPVRLKDPFMKKKDQIFKLLRTQGLGVQVHYIPIYKQLYYQKLGYQDVICPFAENFYQREISLPLYPGLREEDIRYIIKTIRKVFLKIKI